MKQFVIKRIREQGDQMIVGIPKKSNFEIGEYVRIEKLEEIKEENLEG